MKRILLFALSLLMLGCGNESSVKPANSNTFVRYFNGGNNDLAVAIRETKDKGLLILATTQIKLSELSPVQYKIKLIKTDEFGNQEWESFYPDFSTADSINYRAGGLFVRGDSVVIVGTHVLSKAITSNLLLITTQLSTKGKTPNILTIPSVVNTEGIGVTENNHQELLVSGLANSSTMIIQRVKYQLGVGALLWSESYNNGNVNLSNKLFLDQNTDGLSLGGTVDRSGKSAIRFTAILVNPNNQGGLLADHTIGNSGYNVVAEDICSFGQTWAFAGSSDSTGTTDIMYMRVNPLTGDVIKKKTFTFTGDGAHQNNSGNSIATTRDGGLLLLGTVNSNKSFGRGLRDYYLIKIDAFGDVKFQLPYGSIFDDVGVQVMQVSDGGYVVLGTTNLANLKTIMLMKTDQEGKIK